MLLEFVGLFLFISGFIIGLGAVTVIDLHGFLGQFSAYWTETTIRSHKITKPLIWLGITLAFLGGLLTYRNENIIGIPLLHLLFGILLVLNGLFLSFRISPELLKRENTGKARELLPRSMQLKIRISFLFSFFGWWGSVLLLVWYLLQTRI